MGYLYKKILMKKSALNEEIVRIKSMMSKLMNEQSTPNPTIVKNLGNILKSVQSNNGVIKDPNSMYNGQSIVDLYNNNTLSDADFKAALEYNKTGTIPTTTSTQTAQTEPQEKGYNYKVKTIAKWLKTVGDTNGVIKDPTSIYNGKSLYDLMNNDKSFADAVSTASDYNKTGNITPYNSPEPETIYQVSDRIKEIAGWLKTNPDGTMISGPFKGQTFQEMLGSPNRPSGAELNAASKYNELIKKSNIKN